MVVVGKPPCFQHFYQPKLTSFYFSHLIGHHIPATVAFLSVLKVTMFLLALTPSHSLCSMLKYTHIPPSPKNPYLSFRLLFQHHFLREAFSSPFPSRSEYPDRFAHGTLNCSSTVPASIWIIICVIYYWMFISSIEFTLQENSSPIHRIHHHISRTLFLKVQPTRINEWI